MVWFIKYIVGLIKGKKSLVKGWFYLYLKRLNLSISLTPLIGKKDLELFQWTTSESKRQTSGSAWAFTTSSNKINGRGRGKFITVPALITLYLGFKTSYKTIQDTHTQECMLKLVHQDKESSMVNESRMKSQCIDLTKKSPSGPDQGIKWPRSLMSYYPRTHAQAHASSAAVFLVHYWFIW